MWEYRVAYEAQNQLGQWQTYYANASSLEAAERMVRLYYGIDRKYHSVRVQRRWVGPWQERKQ